MSKSILVLDNNPENCKKCCFLEYDLLGQERCSATVKTIKDSDKKQAWCPLKPLPDKISLEKSELDFKREKAVDAISHFIDYPDRCSLTDQFMEYLKMARDALKRGE